MTNLFKYFRYSPTAVTGDDDDTNKGLLENNQSDALSTPHTQVVPLQTVPLQQIEIQPNISANISSATQQLIVPPTVPMQHPVVPAVAQLQQFNIPVQQPNYLTNPQVQKQTVEAINESTNQQQNLPILNGKDDSAEKVSKGSTVLGKSQAKKRLMAFSMMKQKLQEQNNPSNDNQSSDIVEGNDVEFIPELNVFQTVQKKKVVTNKKGKYVFNLLFINLYILFCTYSIISHNSLFIYNLL